MPQQAQSSYIANFVRLFAMDEYYTTVLLRKINQVLDEDLTVLSRDIIRSCYVIWFTRHFEMNEVNTKVLYNKCADIFDSALGNEPATHIINSAYVNRFLLYHKINQSSAQRFSTILTLAISAEDTLRDWIKSNVQADVDYATYTLVKLCFGSIKYSSATIAVISELKKHSSSDLQMATIATTTEVAAIVAYEMYDHYNTLIQEWGIWSSCFGRLIVLNGVSSSGKTTLAASYIEQGFSVISMDLVHKELVYRKLNQDLKLSALIQVMKCFLTPNSLEYLIIGYKIPSDGLGTNELDLINDLRCNLGEICCCSREDILGEMYKQSAQILFRGEGVVLDVVLSSNQRIDMLRYSYGNYPMEIVLLFDTLEQNISKCLQRGYSAVQLQQLQEFRSPVAHVLYQYQRFYKFEPICNVDPSIVLEVVDLNSYLRVLDIAHAIEIKRIELLSLVSYGITSAEILQFTENANYIVKTFRAKLLEAAKGGIVGIVPNIKYDKLITTQNISIHSTDTTASVEQDNYRVVYHSNSETIPMLYGSNLPVREVINCEALGTSVTLDLMGYIKSFEMV